MTGKWFRALGLSTLLALAGADVALAATHASGAVDMPRVNREFSVVLRNARGVERAFRVCAVDEASAVRGARQAWGTPNAQVVSVQFLGPCTR